jgi:SMI1 / KNR4 family (SUKH-1)
MPFPTTEASVATAEQDLAVRLPREYRDRLDSVNGGELSTGDDDWAVFPVVDLSHPATGRTKDMVAETRRARGVEGFPAGAVAIASNTADDLLILIPTGNKSLDPQVRLWNHETRQCKAVPLRYDDKQA